MKIMEKMEKERLINLCVFTFETLGHRQKCKSNQYSFNRYLLSIISVPGIILGFWFIYKTDKGPYVLAIRKLTF